MAEDGTSGETERNTIRRIGSGGKSEDGRIARMGGTGQREVRAAIGIAATGPRAGSADLVGLSEAGDESSSGGPVTFLEKGTPKAWAGVRAWRGTIEERRSNGDHG